MAVRKVVDISSYNGRFDFASAKKQGLDGAILKIVRRDMLFDTQFKNNYAGCERYGIDWGVYNYSYATTVSKAMADMEQICNRLDKLDKKYFKLGVWFDIEDAIQEKLTQASIASIINAAEKVVVSRGYPFGVYTGLAFYKKHIRRELVECKNWWIARYYKGYNTMSFKTNPNEQYKPLSDIVAWQYTSSGRFNPAICKGNEGNVDLNVMYKDIQSDKKGADKVAVKIGSARINEKGTVTGGKPGDQTGGEVSTQNWYLHSKGWVVIRPKDKTLAEKIAKCMEMACANNNIGYCQTHRDDLRKESAKYGYDVSKVKVKLEVDCSALVRVCCLYAGINVGDFNTASQKSVLERSGKFEVITDKSICNSSDKLRRGDILVTKTKGHTVVVLTNGKNAGSATNNKDKGGSDYMFSVGLIKKGSKGKEVLLFEKVAKANGDYSGKLDGEYGSECAKACKKIQKRAGFKDKDVDGECGSKTWPEVLGI